MDNVDDAPFEDGGHWAYGGSSFAGGDVDGALEEEEEYVFWLSRRMAGAFLDDDDDDDQISSPKLAAAAVSPQSTLYMGGYLSSPSGQESPNELVRPGGDNSPSDLLYQAAGQLARLRRSNAPNSAKNFAWNVSPAPQPATATAAATSAKPSYCPVYIAASVKQRQQQLAYMKMRQQQLFDQQTAAASWGRGYAAAAGPASPLGLSPSAWPPLEKSGKQPPVASERVQPSFSKYSQGGERKSTGTGVFLPRHRDLPAKTTTTPPPAHHRKKSSACAPILLPARVVQQLNLNLDDLSPQAIPGGFLLDHATLVNRSTALASQKRGKPAPAMPVRAPPARAAPPPPPSPLLAQELNLPSEWTY